MLTAYLLAFFFKNLKLLLKFIRNFLYKHKTRRYSIINKCFGYTKKLKIKKKKITTYFLFFKKLKFKKYSIKFKPSNLLGLNNFFSLQNMNVLFLRKNKVFNKSRYSRNRQYYRTGFYWCLYINIALVLGFYFWFYRLTFNFGYIWWLLYFFFLSFFVSKFFNLYKLFDIKTIILKLLSWLTYLFKQKDFFFFLKKNSYFKFFF